MADQDNFDDQKLKALLSNEIQSALTYDDTELSQKRAKAIEYFRGQMDDTPAMEGRSSIVSRDVADTIGWMLPGIIRVFTASDRIVLYEPEKPNDEEFAEQATDYINYVFMKENAGYRILWNATHDSLLLGNGIIKHWWDPTEEIETTEHSGLTEEQIAILMSDQFVEVVAQKPGVPQVCYIPDQASGQVIEQKIQTYDVKIKRVVRSGRLRVDCINAEDFLLDRDTTSIEEYRFCAHRSDRSRSELIKMGFDRDLVESLPIDRFAMMQQEKIAREDDTQAFFNMVGDESMMLVELFECYVKADVDGDGISETVRAFYAGQAGAGELLDWEVWDDDVPFSDIPCEPIPHRWEARSVYDDTNDIQRVKTVLTRQFLDNLYWVNNPLTTAEEGSVTNPDMLRSPKFGGTVYHKKGTTPPTALAIPFIGDKALLGLQHFDTVREMRTGVSRSTMALDPEALQNQTATANQNQKDAAYSQIELIARNQAELGWRRVFRQMLKLIVKHQDRPRTIRLRDEWVEMDPRAWNANMDATINIGLGTGSRDRDMAMLGTILNGQMSITTQLADRGFAEQALEMVPKINMTLTKIAESAGIKNPEQFYLDLSPEVLQQMQQRSQQIASQPDPKMQIEQLKAQKDLQIQASEHQSNAIRAQAEIQKADSEAQIKIIEARAKMHEADMRQQLAAAQIQIDQMKAQAQNETVLTKAALDNLVKLEIARINASKDTDPKPDAVESKLSQEAGVSGNA